MPCVKRVTDPGLFVTLPWRDDFVSTDKSRVKWYSLKYSFCNGNYHGTTYLLKTF